MKWMTRLFVSGIALLALGLVPGGSSALTGPGDADLVITFDDLSPGLLVAGASIAEGVTLGGMHAGYEVVWVVDTGGGNMAIEQASVSGVMTNVLFTFDGAVTGAGADVTYVTTADPEESQRSILAYDSLDNLIGGWTSSAEQEQSVFMSIYGQTDPTIHRIGFIPTPNQTTQTFQVDNLSLVFAPEPAGSVSAAAALAALGGLARLSCRSSSRATRRI